MAKLKISMGLGAVSFLFLLVHSAVAAPQMIKGHLMRAAAADALVGPLGDEFSLDLVVGLPLRDPKGLEDFLKDVYDPRSPQFRNFLTPDEFIARFSPTTADYERVEAFLRSKGLSISATYPNRLMVDVKLSAADVKRVFHTGLSRFRRPDGSLFFAPDSEPSVDLDVPLSHISGLDNFARPKSKLRRSVASGFKPKAGTGIGGLYQGQDFRNAYLPGVSASSDGSGQRVALVEFNGFYQSDITYYKNNSSPSFTAPAPTTVLIDGYNGIPILAGGRFLDIDEVTLDIEMVNAIAPGAQVVVYESSGSSVNTNFDHMLQSMTLPPLAYQISSSWGGFGDSTARNLLNQLAAQGQAYFEAAGDDGSYDVAGSIDAVAGDPSLYLTSVETLVGGTELTTAGPSYSSESTWSTTIQSTPVAGGGGICTGLLAIPSYQSPVPMGTNSGSTVYRNFPDVSMAADGILLVSNNYPSGSNSYLGLVEGTSAASPLWAGFLAIVNQQGAASGKGALGSANNALYALALTPTTYSNDFNDINDGSNNNFSGSGLYPAVTGYDLATGWGSPKGQPLINDLVGMIPTPTPTFTGTPTRTPTPTVTPCGWPSQTCTFTWTPTVTYTPTSTPTQVLSNLGQVVLAPVPVSRGEKLCLYPDRHIKSSQWDVFNFTGESLASLSFPSDLKNCWDTGGAAPGVYMIRMKIQYLDGTEAVIWKKIIVKP